MANDTSTDPRQHPDEQEKRRIIMHQHQHIIESRLEALETEARIQVRIPKNG